MEIITITSVGFVDTEIRYTIRCHSNFLSFFSKAVSLQYSVHSRRHACDNTIYIIYRNII